MAYVDYIAIVAENKATLQMALMVWGEVLHREGLRMNRIKTEVMKIAKEHEDLNIEVDGVRIKL